MDVAADMDVDSDVDADMDVESDVDADMDVDSDTDADTDVDADGDPRGSVVVNEIDYDQPGGDSAEFVELYNRGTSPVDLSLLDLVFVNGYYTPPAIYETYPLGPEVLGPGEYFVIGWSSVTTGLTCGTITMSDTIQNGPDAVALVLADTTTIIDTVSYGGGVDGWVEGVVGAPDDDELGSIQRNPTGDDTDDNELDFEYFDTPTPCGPPL